MAPVDGQTCSLMGEKKSDDDILPAVVSSADYTSTHSVFTLSAGSATSTLDFFSPVSPNYLRQSLPFSCLSVSVSAASANNIQVYSSIDGRWRGKQESIERIFQNKESTAVSP
ncbi:hypothetical protein ETB97_010759 [Aspergillus alliaceus]|uniref:Glutaminase A N-terminal domain-containing protein n=1 Tax=Petromyces alliaceus TaxID=209559 RepID=A0A8H6AF05_PETAA|nr:hypothetical protein ETB97_010759 [Aspergillus burnettii]